MEFLKITERKFIALDALERKIYKDVEGSEKIRIDGKNVYVYDENGKCILEIIIKKTKHKAAQTNSSQIRGMGMGEQAFWNFTFIIVK